MFRTDMHPKELLQCHKEKSRKAELPGYKLFNTEMPLTNPADEYDELEAAFLRSGYAS